MTSPSELRVRLLGGLQVEGVASTRLGSRKARTLLKLLALGRGAPVPLDRIVDALWPEALPARPAEQIGVLISRLRAALGPERLPRTEAGWSLQADWLDIAELQVRSQQAAGRLRAGRPGASRAAASAALALVRGPLLPEEDLAWVDAERASSATRSQIQLGGNC